jgi:hypothetical protein
MSKELVMKNLWKALETSDENCEQLLWEALLLFQNECFYTAKNLEFTYIIKGKEIFFSRKEKSITRSTVMIALRKALELNRIVSGPKKLGCFGASYLYPVFLELGIIKKVGN